MTRHRRSSDKEKDDIQNEPHRRRRKQSNRIKYKKRISIHSNIRENNEAGRTHDGEERSGEKRDGRVAEGVWWAGRVAACVPLRNGGLGCRRRGPRVSEGFGNG